MNKDIMKIAIHYGIEAQARQTMEECAELIVALNKYLRKTTNVQGVNDEYLAVRKNVAEEIADVKIMLEQIECLLECEKLVEIIKESKILRTLQRMDMEE